MTTPVGTRVRIRSAFRGDPVNGREGTVEAATDANMVKRLGEFTVLVRFDIPVMQPDGYAMHRSYFAPGELERLGLATGEGQEAAQP